MKKYLTFIEQSNQINEQFELGDREIKLLDLVGKIYYSSHTVFVGDLISNRNIASQATLRATLKKLIHKKLLYLKTDAEDGRMKIVTLTKQALDRYKRLDIALAGKVL
jgi:DNA-binding MarR family transcriptional regulator